MVKSDGGTATEAIQMLGAGLLQPDEASAALVARASPNLVLTPWQNRLYKAISDAKSEVLIVSPYIKLGIASKVRGAVPPGVKLRTITRFKESDFAAGASDVDAVWLLSQLEGEHCEARFVNILHAKIYIIDLKTAFLGSSNLTFSGLMRNHEACIEFVNHDFVDVLRRQFEELWMRAETLDRELFLEMVAVLRSAKEVSRAESDHFYSIKERLNFFENDEANIWNDSAIQYAPVKQTSLATKIFSATLPDVALFLENRSAEKQGSQNGIITNRLSGDQKDPGDEPASSAETVDSEVTEEEKVRERIRIPHLLASQHDQVAREFLEKLKFRFNIRTEKSPNLYTLAICGPSLGNLNKHPKDNEPFRTECLDVTQVWGQTKKCQSLEQIGISTFDIACFISAHKAGLVDRFGPQIVDLLVAYAKRSGILEAYWHQNFLGPLLGWAVARSGEEDDFQLAVWRLVGAVSIGDGLGRALELVEEFFNPLDQIGENIADIRQMRDSKTLLQEVTLSGTKSHPNYHAEVVDGPSHKPIFNCVVSVGKTIRAVGTGTSKGKAEASAATIALDEMCRIPGWQKVMEKLREETLARFSSDVRYSIRPKRGLSMATKIRVLNAYKDRLGIDIDPDYGLLALTASEMNLQARHHYDNRPLARLGVHVSDWLARQKQWPDGFENRNFMRFFIAAMPEVLDVEGLRLELGFSGEISAAMRLDVAQAIVAAIFVSTESTKFAEVLAPLIARILAAAEQVSSRQVGIKASSLTSSPGLDTFDSSLDYTSVLQEKVHRDGKNLPKVLYLTTGPSHQATHEAIIEIESWKVRGLGNSRRAARNNASFEMLRLLTKQ